MFRIFIILALLLIAIPATAGSVRQVTLPPCGDVSGWLPLLGQTQSAIQAVEAAMRESLTPGQGTPDLADRGNRPSKAHFTKA